MADNPSQTPGATTSEPTQPTPTTPTEKMVPESDVVKAKGGLQKQLEESKAQLNEAYNLRLQAEAKVKTLEENQVKSAVQQKELDSLKESLDKVTKATTAAEAKALEYRKKLIVKEYNTTDEAVKDLGMPELDMFERALRVVKSASGSYAAGGGGGISTPSTSMERALKNLERAERGTPNQKQQ